MPSTNTTTALSTEVRTSRVPPRRRFFALLTEEYRLRTHKSAELAVDLVFFLIAAALAGAHGLFGVYPFAIALLCAAERRILPILAGAAVGCYFLGTAGLLYLSVLALVLLGRILFSYPRPTRLLPESGRLFCEDPRLRVALCLLAGLGMATYELIVGGISSTTVLFALGALFLPALACFVYLGVFASDVDYRTLLGKGRDERASFGRVHPAHFELGVLLLLYSLTLSLRGISFFGVSVATLVGSFAVLLVARRFGALRGCVAGLAVGLAGEAAFIPSFALLGLLAGCCWGIGMPCALSAAVLAAGGFAVYADGLSGFLAVVPETSVTALLAWPYLRTLSRAQGGFFRRRVTVAHAPPAYDEPPAPPTAGERLGALSVAFLSLSRALHRTADGQRAPDIEDYKQMCHTVRENHCRKCPRFSSSLGEGGCGRRIYEAVNGFAERLARGESPSCDDDTLCEVLPHMLAEMRGAKEALLKKHRRRTAEELFSVDYALLAQILEQAAAEMSAERGEDEAAAAALSVKLCEAGIRAERVRVYGRRRRRICIEDASWEGGKTGIEERMREICQGLFGKGFTLPSGVYDGRCMSYQLSPRRLFRLTAAYKGASLSPHEPSGDAVALFEDGEGRAYALLSDGMGSGVRANRTSETAVAVLSCLLSAGVEHTTALRMLNNLIMGGEESSATVDLFCFDLDGGRAVFVKSGAASSFVFRDGSLFRVRAKTLPIGLLEMPDAEQIGFEVAAGDTIVMLSDGALHGREDGAWLKELLQRRSNEPPEALCADILSAARAAALMPDDMTVMLLRVEAQDEAAEGEERVA